MTREKRFKKTLPKTQTRTCQRESFFFLVFCYNLCMYVQNILQSAYCFTFTQKCGNVILKWVFRK